MEDRGSGSDYTAGVEANKVEIIMSWAAVGIDNNELVNCAVFCASVT